MKKIGVIGAGIMGCGITQILAQNGFEVVLNDIRKELLEAALNSIQKRFDRNVKKERMTLAEKEQALQNISLAVELNAMADCDAVIEAVSENMAVKKEIFTRLDVICNEKTILATNTSSLSITEIAQCTGRPDRIIGMHFFNPVPIMKLVEVIKGIATSEEVKDQVMTLAEKLGKTPVLVEEAPGFVVNRILIPMINEAIGVLADGVATVEDIDKAMTLGANHPIGPLALADLVGLDVCLAIMEVLYQEFADPKYRPHPLLRKMVRGRKLGRKTGAGFYTY